MSQLALRTIILIQFGLRKRLQQLYIHPLPWSQLNKPELCHGFEVKKCCNACYKDKMKE